MLVEPVAGSPWNGWPDVHGIRGRINVVRAVRFDTDQIVTSVASFQAGDVPSVPVVEVRL